MNFHRSTKNLVLVSVFIAVSVLPMRANIIQIDSDAPIQIVDVHQGDDDHAEGTVTLKPAPGKYFKDFRLSEIGKYGDTNYQLITKTPTEITVGWSATSHRVRGPFNVVVDTHTAYLGLSAQAQLEDKTSSPAPVQQNPSIPAPKASGFFKSLESVYGQFDIKTILAYFGTIFAAIGVLWTGLPNKYKEQFIDWLLSRMRRKKDKDQKKPRILD